LPVEDIVVLPRHVLQTNNTVLSVDAKSELEILPVTVLRAEPKKVYISSGIYTGTHVITTTLDAPVPGTRLTVREVGWTTASVTTEADEP